MCAGTSVWPGASAAASAGEIAFRGRVIQEKHCLGDVKTAEKSIHLKTSCSCTSKDQKSVRTANSLKILKVRFGEEDINAAK